MRRSLLLVAALAATFTAAARAETATIYQPIAFSKTSSGYSELPLDVNRVRVTFVGEAGTDRETVEANLLHRLAETTILRGFDYFVVTDHDVEAKTQTERKGPPLPPLAPRRTKEVTRYSAVSEIVMYKGAKPADASNAYDARATQANLQWRISRR